VAQVCSERMERGAIPCVNTRPLILKESTEDTAGPAMGLLCSSPPFLSLRKRWEEQEYIISTVLGAYE